MQGWGGGNKPPMRPPCSMIAWGRGGEEGRHDAGVGRREVIYVK